MSVLRRLAPLALALLAAIPDAAAQSLTIGAPLPLTGPLSPEGIKLRQGYELWLDQVNKAGGIAVGTAKLPVQLVFYDYESNTPRAVQLAEKLITDDKVNFMFSPFGSGATKAASSVAERYGVPMLASTASSVEVFDQGYKNLFGVLTANETLAEPIAELIKTKAPQVKKLAIMARNDLYPLSLANDFDKSAKKRGIEVASFDKYAIGTLDHASTLTQMRGSRPDWVVITGYINDLILARKQMGDLGVRAAVVTMINGPAYQEFIEATGAQSDGLTSATWWHPVVKYKSQDVFGSAESFTEQFRAKYKTEPDFTSAAGAAIGVVLQMAIEKAGTLDRDKVRAALAAGGFPTFYGPITFSPVGMANSYTPPVIQIQDRKIVVVHPPELATGEFRLARR